MRRLRPAALVLLRALCSPARGAAWSWPADGAVLQPFAFDRPTRTRPDSTAASTSAARRARVRAPSGGDVTFAGTVAGDGHTLTIATADGYTVTLTHLGSIAVDEGATVAEGDAVGTIGPTGTRSSPCRTSTSASASRGRERLPRPARAAAARAPVDPAPSHRPAGACAGARACPAAPRPLRGAAPPAPAPALAASPPPGARSARSGRAPPALAPSPTPVAHASRRHRPGAPRRRRRPARPLPPASRPALASTRAGTARRPRPATRGSVAARRLPRPARRVGVAGQRRSREQDSAAPPPARSGRRDRAAAQNARPRATPRPAAPAARRAVAARAVASRADAAGAAAGPRRRRRPLLARRSTPCALAGRARRFAAARRRRRRGRLLSLTAMRFYVTTPIYYVNSTPHIGHAYTTIAADILVRHHRQRGEETFFLTGRRRARRQGRARRRGAGPHAAGVRRPDRRAPGGSCRDGSNASNDFFIRTSDEGHKAFVQDFLQRIYDNGDVYEDVYAGLYCVGCEAFKTEDELVDGKCPIHGTAPEWIEEKNYFFRLSAYQDRLLELYDERPDFVLPRLPLQRGAQLHRGRPARLLDQPRGPAVGRSRSRGIRSRSPTSGPTRSSTT